MLFGLSKSPLAALGVILPWLIKPNVFDTGPLLFKYMLMDNQAVIVKLKNWFLGKPSVPVWKIY